jgi:glycosyltransferase involved in cell wall biosynthesis
VLLEGTYLAQYIPAIRQTKVACKVALRTHNVEFEIWKRLAIQTQNPIKKAYFQHLATRGEVFEKWAATQPDAWIAITEKDAQWYRKHSPHKPNIVIPSGANLAEPPVPSDFQPTYQAGFLASLDWQPNLQGLKWFVHQVLPMVVDKCSNFKLKVAGRNPGQEVLQLAGPHVQVLGEVEDAAQFFAENRVMVVPLLAGSSMRVKLLEQFGAGCAVISTPVGAEGLAVTHNQELLIAADAPAFAQSLLHLMQDAALQHRLAISGYQFVKDTYSWQAIGKQFSTFFATL